MKQLLHVCTIQTTTKGRCIISHVATINVEIKSLDDLESAARSLGLELVRGQQTYRWYGKSVGDYPLPVGFTAEELGRCDHAIRVPLSVTGADRCYEIGVVKRRDGKPGYQLLWDFFDGGRCQFAVGDCCGPGAVEDADYNPHQTRLVSFVGGNGQKLVQSYARVTAIRTAQQQGFRVQESRQADGSIKLVFQKG